VFAQGNNWDNLIERFELYVSLNEINSHKKHLLFLTLMENDGYSLLRDLCTPQKPIDKKYDDLKSLLSSYINPKPNLITERYKFKEHRQAANESVIQFITRLKKISPPEIFFLVTALPVGILKVKVKYKNHFELLSLYIVVDGGPAIIGRNCLTRLEILPLEFNLHSTSQQNVIQMYPSVFSEKLVF